MPRGPPRSTSSTSSSPPGACAPMRAGCSSRAPWERTCCRGSPVGMTCTRSSPPCTSRPRTRVSRGRLRRGLAESAVRARVPRADLASHHPPMADVPRSSPRLAVRVSGVEEVQLRVEIVPVRLHLGRPGPLDEEVTEEVEASGLPLPVDGPEGLPRGGVLEEEGPEALVRVPVPSLAGGRGEPPLPLLEGLERRDPLLLAHVLALPEGRGVRLGRRVRLPRRVGEGLLRLDQVVRGGPLPSPPLAPAGDDRVPVGVEALIEDDEQPGGSDSGEELAQGPGHVGRAVPAGDLAHPL